MAIVVENTGITSGKGYLLVEGGKTFKGTVGRLGISRRDVVVDPECKVTVTERLVFQRSGELPETTCHLNEVGDKITIDSPCGVDNLVKSFGFGVIGGFLEIRKVKS